VCPQVYAEEPSNPPTGSGGGDPPTGSDGGGGAGEESATLSPLASGLSIAGAATAFVSGASLV
jgi:hypothetical protein